MNKESRVHKSLLNARIGIIYYIAFILLSFFSRKTFLECLGADFLGLSGTLVNILGMLSLAEMGVGAAVAYNLYKPLEEGNRERIEELVSVFGFLYRRIGIFILGASLILACFIPLIFKNTFFPLGLIYFAFFTTLLSSLFSYFLNYRQIILTADQRGYVVTVYLQGTMFIKVLLQMAVAYYTGNYYIWLLLEIVYGVASCLVLNWKISKVYPWLDANVSKGRIAYPANKQLMTFTRQVFVHKIKDFFLRQSDQILIFAFVSLKMVAYYGNYTLVVSRISGVFSAVLGSFNAGVGNLIAEGNRERLLSVFWELVSVQFIVAGFLVFSVYNLIEPFITLWIGAEYVLDKSILILMMINVMISHTRTAVDIFNSGYGHYADTWSAWVEGGLNIGVALALAPFLGICGIILGQIVSLCLIVVLWKPYYLFHDGFNISVWHYWKNIIKYYFILFGCMGFGTWIFHLIPLNEYESFVLWSAKAFVTIVPFTLFYVSVLYIANKGTRDLIHRIAFMVNNKYCWR